MKRIGNTIIIGVDLPEVRYRIERTPVKNRLKEPEHPAQDEPTHKPKRRGHSR